MLESSILTLAPAATPAVFFCATWTSKSRGSISAIRSPALTAWLSTTASFRIGPATLGATETAVASRNASSVDSWVKLSAIKYNLK